MDVYDNEDDELHWGFKMNYSKKKYSIILACVLVVSVSLWTTQAAVISQNLFGNHEWHSIDPGLSYPVFGNLPTFSTFNIPEETRENPFVTQIPGGFPSQNIPPVVPSSPGAFDTSLFGDLPWMHPKGQYASMAYGIQSRRKR